MSGTESISGRKQDTYPVYKLLIIQIISYLTRTRKLAPLCRHPASGSFLREWGGKTHDD
jgi:hypothetical protein